MLQREKAGRGIHREIMVVVVVVVVVVICFQVVKGKDKSHYKLKDLVDLLLLLRVFDPLSQFKPASDSFTPQVQTTRPKSPT